MRSASVSAERALLVQARVRWLARSHLSAEVELGRMGRASGSGLGGRLLEWWSSGRVEMFQLGSIADSCKKVRWVGSRRDPSDGQVSLVVDFTIPPLRRGAGAFIAIVTGYPYLKPLSSLLLIIPLHLTTPSVVLAAKRAPAAGGCRRCPPYPC
ncbi:hypothetical protein BHE74_00038998 [Ensete ventricosum]|nr:hypothetical protein BHE74_00038998 [Ensete ventricosum]